jgi:hypothetical protein
MDTTKPMCGEMWENIHTKTRTKILSRIFFNIHHEYYFGTILMDTYTHYKTFQKHWIKVKECENNGFKIHL